MTPDDLLARGWRPIVSEAQATHLLRRELKHYEAWQQRTPGCRPDARRLLAIKPGVWFKLRRGSQNGSIMLWRLTNDNRRTD